MTTLPHFWKDFDKFGVGFDSVFDRIDRFQNELSRTNPSYPPYNIRRLDETNYTIELAVAGFSESQIDIEVHDGKLVVKGDVGDVKEEENFLFKGIATRAFTRTFALNDQVEVKDAEMKNGMLVISLERIVPEEAKPKKIQVRAVGDQQLLTE